MASRALLAVAALAAVGAPPADAAYRPVFSLMLSDGGPAVAPAVTVTVTQGSGESANRRIAVRYPPQFGFNPGFSATGCSPAAEQADACPEASRIGRSRAETSLGTFSGPVHITADYRLLSYLRDFAGVTQQELVGKLYLHPDGSVETVFDDLPDFPTTLAETSIEGGSRTILLTPRRCGTYPVTGTFTSHAREEVVARVPVAITGCRQRPEISSARAAPRRFRRRTLLRWRLATPALRTELSVQRVLGDRWRELRRLRGPAHAGANELTLSGRRLRPGRYRFVLRAVGADGVVSRARAARATRVR